MVLCAWLLLGSPKPPAWIAWVAALMLAGCACAAWDYWRISQIYLPVDERSSYYRDNTMDKLRKSWLFESQVQFAELTTTNLTADSAEQIYEQALQLLHFSSEPRVIEKLIESATLLGRNDDAAYYLQRYKAAFPDAYARWTAASAGHKAP
ncbi:MAG: Wzy polymerase domain-containing protein [Rhodoferax sp.]